MNQKKECMDVHVNGLKFHVQTFGSGVPIIMIMGLGAPGDKWKPVSYTHLTLPTIA